MPEPLLLETKESDVISK